MIENLLIYISHDFNPYKNIAVEKYLTDTCPKDTLILYLWQNDNTVVIGRNQNPYTEIAADADCLIARRLSGGGAVYHDRGNLNFTFISPGELMDIARNMDIIKNAISKADIITEISGRNDILANGRKFSGNAFYNSAGNSYHHGTIMINSDLDRVQKLLTPPKAKLDAKGVKSVRSRVVNLSELNPALNIADMINYMVDASGEYFNLIPKKTAIPINVNISELEKELSSKDFIYGKTPPFNMETEGHFAWGNIQIKLHVVSNVINSAVIYSDAMDESLGEKFSKAIGGIEYNKDKITEALMKSMDEDIAKDIVGMIYHISVNSKQDI